MKTQIKILLCALITMLIFNQSNAQSDIAGVMTGHQGFSFTNYYVGWDANTTFPLNIEQNNITTPQPIHFWTKQTQKMTILGTTGGDDGFVGLGEYFYNPSGTGNNPKYQLDINVSSLNTYGGDVNIAPATQSGYCIGGSGYDQGYNKYEVLKYHDNSPFAVV